MEGDYKRLAIPEMSVWDEQHPKPEGGPEFERRLVRWLNEDAQKQLRELAKSPGQYRKTIAGALDVIIGRTLAEAGDVEWDMKRKEDRGDYLEMSGLLRNRTHREELPAVFLYPKQWDGHTVIWLTETGKGGLYNDSGSLIADVQKLLAAKVTVMGIDLLYQGEFLTNSQQMVKTGRVKNPREAAPFTFGYNRALFAQRVHDILSVVKYIQDHERKTEVLDVVGLDRTGPLVAAARSQAGDAITRAAIRTGGFRFDRVLDIHDVNFLPGSAKYGDLSGMLAFAAPNRVWLADEGETREGVLAAYRESGAPESLTVYSGSADQSRDAAVKWLLSSARR